MPPTSHSARPPTHWLPLLPPGSEGGAVVWRMSHHQSQSQRRRVYLGAYHGKSMHNVWKALGDFPLAADRSHVVVSRRSLTGRAEGGRGRVIGSVGVKRHSWVCQSALGRRYQAARFTIFTPSFEACKPSAPACSLFSSPRGADSSCTTLPLPQNPLRSQTLPALLQG